MFQLNREEIPEGFSKSQFATLNEKSNRQGSNIKKMPFAFTEQGIYMLATVLRGELAEQQSIFIMRGRGFLTNSLVTDSQNGYPTIRIKPNPDCHDRLIILDYGEKTELVYHCGASSKDAGKKLCAINQITETAIIHPVIDRLLSLPDKPI